MPIKFSSYLGLFPEDRFSGPELPSDQLYVNGMAFLDSLPKGRSSVTKP